MRTRKLGRSDLEVSVLGMGTWGLADPRIWGPVDEADAIRAIHAALDAGVTLIDTAEGYGHGRAEEIVGKAVEGRRDGVVLASKVSPEHHRRDDLLHACEGSLHRLRTDRIDLYLLHWPNHEIGFEEPLRAMESLREQGKIRVAGVSNFGVRDLAEILAVGRVEANQLPYNLLWRAIEHEIAPLCRKEEVGILAYSPLLQGVLSGAFASADDVPPGQARTAHFAGTRSLAPHEGEGAEALTFAAVDSLRDLARATGHSMVELALGWILARSEFAAAIVGIRSAEEAEADARASDVILDEATLAALDDATKPIMRHFGKHPDLFGIQGRMR